jgi:Clathrin light chain
MAKNRQDEQEKLEAIEADLENDNSWQRVCKMVDLSHDAAEGSADVSRMRDVLIFLKNDTTKALELGA